jgi:hypothetical protein
MAGELRLRRLSILVKCRAALLAPTDGWKQKHDDSYYREAVEKSR